MRRGGSFVIVVDDCNKCGEKLTMAHNCLILKSSRSAAHNAGGS